jgi:hypothetical protein
MLHVCFWSFYPQMSTISARSIYLHLLLEWFLIEAYSYPCRVKWNPVVLSWLLIHLFLQFRGDPPTSYGYIKVITPPSLHRYPYIDHYKFSVLLMLSHKQMNENMVTRQKKLLVCIMSVIPACICCISNNIIHEHGNALHDMCIWKPEFGLTYIHTESFTFSTLFFLRWWCCDPWTKMPRWNLVYHVCCIHVITTRSTLGILFVRMRLTPDPNFSILQATI